MAQTLATSHPYGFSPAAFGGGAVSSAALVRTLLSAAHRRGLAGPSAEENAAFCFRLDADKFGAPTEAPVPLRAIRVTLAAANV